MFANIAFEKKKDAVRAAEDAKFFGGSFFITVLGLLSLLGAASFVFSIVYEGPFEFFLRTGTAIGLISFVLFLYARHFYSDYERKIGFKGRKEPYNIFEVADFESIRILSDLDFKKGNIQKIFYRLANTKRGLFILHEMGAGRDHLNSLALGLPVEQQHLLRAFSFAVGNAAEEKRKKVTAADLFLGLASSSAAFSSTLTTLDLSPDDFKNIVYWANSFFDSLEEKRSGSVSNSQSAGIAQGWASGYTLFLDHFSVNICDPRFFQGYTAKGRENVLSQMENILSKSSKNNCILVGGLGSGKTSLVYNFAEKVYWGEVTGDLAYSRIIRLDTASLLSGEIGQGVLEQRLLGVLNDAVRAGDVVLFIDDVKNLFSGSGVGSIDATQIFLPFLESSRLKIVCTATPSEYETYISPRPISAYFTKVSIDPPEKENTIKILEDMSLYFTVKYKISITYNALKEIYDLADSLVADKEFPGKAVDLLENLAGSIKNEKGKVLDKSSVQRFATEILKVPVAEADTQEKDTLLSLEQTLHQRVIGQEEAVIAVSDALRRVRAAVSGNKKRPIGTFLFLGPTGVGKTELAKALAAAYFKSEENIIRLDMNQYQEAGSIERFLGKKISGQEDLEGGDLIKQVKERPFSVILLDEIEKAGKEILNAFLQILDEGYVVDPLGRKISFANTLIIGTSNAGANIIREGVMTGLTIEELRSGLLETLQKEGVFSPEFLNRFDGVILFKPLTEGQLLDVARLMFNEIKRDMEAKGFSIDIEQPALEKLVSLGYQPEFGARPMRRVFQDKVEAVLARKILDGSLKKGETFLVKVDQIHA